MKINRSLVLLVPALVLGILAGTAFAQTSNLANPAALNEQSPATYKVRFDTSKGTFVVEVHRDWAPNGADRFYNLVKNGFYDDTRFFRVVSGFMVQFGINGDPRVATPWRSATMKDDPVKQSNKHVRNRRSGFPDKPGVHQLCRQFTSRSPGLLAVRSGDLGNERG
jgi:peptidyl-prolyl cis-trans isomerase A (cyclophilin A)